MVASAKISQIWWLALAVASISLIVLLAGQQANASPMSGSMLELGMQQTPPQLRQQQQQQQQQPGDYNNFDNLISEFFDDAGNLHKKSKMNSMRQIKQTLRFGRRSDPLMAPTFGGGSGGGGERLELNANANDHEQRRLFAFDE